MLSVTVATTSTVIVRYLAVVGALPLKVDNSCLFWPREGAEDRGVPFGME